MRFSGEYNYKQSTFLFPYGSYLSKSLSMDVDAPGHSLNYYTLLVNGFLRGVSNITIYWSSAYSIRAEYPLVKEIQADAVVSLADHIVAEDG